MTLQTAFINKRYRISRVVWPTLHEMQRQEQSFPRAAIERSHDMRLQRQPVSVWPLLWCRRGAHVNDHYRSANKITPPGLTPYEWQLYRTLNLPIDELAWDMCFYSDIFRTTDWYCSCHVWCIPYVTWLIYTWTAFRWWLVCEDWGNSQTFSDMSHHCIYGNPTTE